MAIGEFLSAGSSLIGAGASAYSQYKTNQKNLQIAREQMRFQELMSSTAYQRAVRDMKAAGLNPMLAFMKGGASTPGGQTATMVNPLGQMGGAVGSALAVATAKKNLRLLEEQVKEQEAKTKVEVERKDAMLAKVWDPNGPWVHPSGRKFTNLLHSQLMEDMLDVRTRRELASSARALNEAELPARLLTGSTAGGILNLIQKTPLSVLIPIMRAGKVGRALKGRR